MQKINENKNDIDDLNQNLTNLEKKLDENGINISKLNQKVNLNKAESNELEMKESVAKVMESMIHYVENTITKEKMDKMGQYDLNSMRSALVNMEEQITILSD